MLDSVESTSWWPAGIWKTNKIQFFAPGILARVAVILLITEHKE